jgi:hypothetical protein
MSAIEKTSPGKEARFFLGFHERGSAPFRSEDRADEVLPVEIYGAATP